MMRTHFVLVLLIRIALALSIMSSSSATSAEWELLFPIYQQGIEVGFINATSDGETITHIRANEVDNALNHLLSSDVVDWLRSLGDGVVTLKALEEHNVRLVFDKQDLSFELTILSDSNKTQSISFDGTPDTFNYTESAFWSWQNTINFSTEYQDGTTTTAEWLGYINIGGYDGLNADWSLYYESGDDYSDVYRGPISLFTDRPRFPWRYTVGDISTDTSGHIDSTTIGGFAWTRSYSDLQPTRQIRNTGNQFIDLNESAQIDVYVNDSQVTRLRLSPGRYSLNDLPLSSGTNNIRLEIRYQSGRTETLVYDQFFYATLLARGADDFGLYTGFVYNYDSGNSIYYQSTPIGTGYYEYGLTEDWTVGINGLTHQDGHLIGGLMYTTQPIGTIALRATSGYLTDEDATPYSISFDYSQQVWGSSSYGSPNLSLSVTKESNYTSTPWDDDSIYTGTDYSLLYTAEISDEWSATVYGYYSTESGEADEHTGRLKLSWSNKNLQITGAVEHTADDDYPDGDVIYTATLQWNWYSSSHDYTASAYYDTDDDTRQIELSKVSNGHVGDWSAVAYYEETSDSAQKYIQAGYTANRFSGDLTAGNSSGDDYVELQLTTAVAVVDGHIGVGNQASGPVVLVDVDDTLESDVYINDSAGEQNPETISNNFLSGILPLYNGHTSQSVEVNVYDAPLGYDTGPGNYTINPGTYTGHVIKVGSSYSKTVIGKLTDPFGQPVALKSGTAVLGDNEVNFFTNRKGRFVLEGIGEGTYTISIDGLPDVFAEAVIPSKSDMLIYLPEIQLRVRNTQ